MIAVNNNLHHNDNDLTFYITKYHFDNGDYDESLNHHALKVHGFNTANFICCHPDRRLKRHSGRNEVEHGIYRCVF